MGPTYFEEDTSSLEEPEAVLWIVVVFVSKMFVSDSVLHYPNQIIAG